MKAAPRLDLGARSAERLLQEFEVKLTNSNVLFWEKTNAGTDDADIAMPKFLFAEEVLRDLEKKQRQNNY